MRILHMTMPEDLRAFCLTSAPSSVHFESNARARGSHKRGRQCLFAVLFGGETKNLVVQVLHLQQNVLLIIVC